jgi:glycerol-3-phosphate dehydrogenase
MSESTARALVSPDAESAAPVLGSRLPADLGARLFDLVVVGGGITGAGIARHAAQAGLSVLLLEAEDFAAGTSSRSTKLIHGGLRYLAMGDVALVREGALERKSVRLMAPHLTEPRWMLVPARSVFEFAKLRIGIGLYELLGAVARDERHRNWDREQMARCEPLLDRKRLSRVCAYREFLTDDTRLVLATLRAAVRDGAVTCSHARVTGIHQDPAGCRMDVTDTRDGSAHEVHGRAVVNAAGPWVESLLRGSSSGSAGPLPVKLHLSKGVHLVVDHDRLPVHNMVMMTAADGRPVFAIPRGQVTYVGTTDTTYEGDPTVWPEVEVGDVEYLLATANAHFDLAPLTGDDVLSTWAGLRPLIHQAGKAPKEMSRRDEIWRDGRMITIAGGKLTGFRRMAEEAMEAVAEVLEVETAMSVPLAPLPGGDIDDLDALRRDVETRYQQDERAAARLVRLYGSEVFAVLGGHPALLSESVFAEEVAWAVRVEGAETLEDVIYRRLRAAWFLPREAEGLLQPCAALMAKLLGWTERRRADEIERVRMLMADELAFQRR